MEYNKYPANTFETLVIGSGVLLSSFSPSTATVVDGDILGPTTGNITFSAKPNYVDFGENINNVPKNTKELKHLDDWEVTMSGNFIAITPTLAEMLAAAADESNGKITPRDHLDLTNDFHDIWLVADYSDKNTGTNAGYVAIHMMNALSTGGFQIQTADKEKGQFSFEFTGHYSKDAADTVPFEIYIKQGT